MFRNIVAEKSASIYAFRMNGIGHRVKALRLAMPKPNSQGALAELAGVNVETVNRIERDNNFEIDSLLKIADVFKVTIGDLLPEDQQPTTKAAPLLIHGKDLGLIPDSPNDYADLIILR